MDTIKCLTTHLAVSAVMASFITAPAMTTSFTAVVSLFTLLPTAFAVMGVVFIPSNRPLPSLDVVKADLMMVIDSSAVEVVC